jgi:hypothetical protein
VRILTFHPGTQTLDRIEAVHGHPSLQVPTSTVPPRHRSMASVVAGAGNIAVAPDAASESGCGLATAQQQQQRCLSPCCCLFAELNVPRPFGEILCIFWKIEESGCASVASGTHLYGAASPPLHCLGISGGRGWEPLVAPDAASESGLPAEVP